ncbi:MAG TPA: signal peptide peptidase SppA, partial [Planococcus sp. (in: firmicutes)]|nr:signal peptide peptidase SppA [Planococcus sp. (in: firmicutes)]
MSTKRWIAIIAAAVLLGVSVVLNSLFAVFQSGLGTGVDELLATADTAYSEYVIEEGNANERIAVLSVDGIIQDTGTGGSLFGGAGYNHQFFMEQLEQVKEDGTIQAVVLKVNTPGGGVIESAQIYDKITEIQEETGKPFYVAMGGMAASGGYYISAPAEKIFVHRETLTGSIGVIMESINYAELADNLGIDFVTIQSGEYKDIMSPTREMRDDERMMLEDMLNDSYESFVDIIVEGREMMTEEEVREVADGRIMNGRQAVEANLADDFGYEEDVVEALKEDFDMANPEVFEYGMSGGFGSMFGLKMNSFFGNS